MSDPVDSPTGYLCVDRFIRTAIDARALQTAFELHLIGRLQERRSTTFDELLARSGCDGAGLRLVLDLLRANSVVIESEGCITLSDQFRAALEYEDLLRAKIDFAELVAADFMHLFTSLIREPARFMRQARLFKLFDYQRCLHETPENYQVTRRWMGLTTALTRYESGVCMHHYDFAEHRRQLDIGGNSGEFALRICNRHPRLEATVFDLPLVCHIGREHVQAHPESTRIRFVAGNALQDTLPGEFDLVTFKSMLHDWPDDHAKHLLSKATPLVKPGGTLLIFERGQFEVGDDGLPYSIIPMLLFFRSFRAASFYVRQMRELGYQDVRAKRIELEMPFILVTARKPQ